MKVPLACAAVLSLLVGGAYLFGAEDGIGGRVRNYFRPVPRAAAEEPPPARGGLSPDGPGAASPPAPAWRGLNREAFAAWEAGEFGAAAGLWDRASAKASPAEALPLRVRADRARLFGLLAGEIGGPPADPAAAEAEYRKRLDGLAAEDGGAWLDLARFAAAGGLRSHLAFLLEQAYARRHGKGGDAVAARTTENLRRAKAAGATPPPEVLESVIRELPSSEAADLAREATGAGIGGVVRRNGESEGSGVDYAKLQEARDLAAKGDAEYRQAVPGSKDVNVHRRRALDLYVKAREIYQEVDDNRGTYGRRIQELNRNIAELHKDLPIGK